ncbi:MAG: DUF1549 domain-containing protein [Bryobacterales bacterium]|nr:DUF1549 domain-containing protein [Bryobacterales bacterium]
MKRHRWIGIGGASAVLWAGAWMIQAQEADPPAHADCSFFGKERVARRAASGDLTVQVAARLGAPRGKTRAASTGSTIDQHLFAAMEEAGAVPAPRTTDSEFLRRVSLDLTGRIPTPEQVVGFLRDGSPDKRQRLIDELLASPAFVDKWTMYFGDHFKNTEFIAFTGVRRFPPGRNAFWKWIRDSIEANKPYDQMARELIAAEGGNSFIDGASNWLVGGFVINRPEHDNWDQQAANIAQTFLGIKHFDCILCHNGRGHLDELSLWGKTATRTSAWGMASFLSRTSATRVPFARDVLPNLYYWRLAPRVVDPRTQRPVPVYPLNTTTGNRPARRPVGEVTSIEPVYPFSGRGPEPGENLRVALAREVTSDFQFSRAAVNYLWKEFFAVGLVEPVDQFDPARLDPDQPPPEPWTLQPSHPWLLNDLAREFAADGFDLKALMRKIVTSEAYQLSSRYEGEWRPEWERLYARKRVRRLWAEEIHDAIAQSSGVVPNYNVGGFSAWSQRETVFTEFPVYGPVNWAMQLPEHRNLPGGTAALFLDSFLRGDREDLGRSGEGSLQQALSLMNDTFVQQRIRANGPLMRRALALSDSELVDLLWISVLSRPPSEDERGQALAALTTGSRTAAAENLLWSLYNKVDFVFNY